MSDDLDLSKLKKKKKKKVVEGDGTEEKATDKTKSKENTAPPQTSEEPAEGAPPVTDELDFGAKKKKKKNKVKAAEDDDSAPQQTASEPVDDGLEPWIHSYDDLLQRVYDIMRAKNPGFDSGERKKIMMKPPQLARVGSKKTAFSNFTDMCRSLKREPKHVLQFLLAELGTSGSVDGNNQLIIKGRFQQKQFESVLRSYIREYVSCHTCKSPDTILQKESETRLYFLKCGVCNSRCSVAAIKTGFQAVTTKRAAARAAAGI